MSFYFDCFEHRKPEPPLKYSPIVESIWQYLAVIALTMGAWYLWWRWDSSLNMDALWYAIPLAFAETAAYIGLMLFVFNLWKVKDYPQQPAPETLKGPLRKISANVPPTNVAMDHTNQCNIS